MFCKLFINTVFENLTDGQRQRVWEDERKRKRGIQGKEERGGGRRARSMKVCVSKKKS